MSYYMGQECQTPGSVQQHGVKHLPIDPALGSIDAQRLNTAMLSKSTLCGGSMEHFDTTNEKRHHVLSEMWMPILL